METKINSGSMGHVGHVPKVNAHNTFRFRNLKYCNSYYYINFTGLLLSGATTFR